MISQWLAAHVDATAIHAMELALLVLCMMLIWRIYQAQGDGTLELSAKAASTAAAGDSACIPNYGHAVAPATDRAPSRDAHNRETQSARQQAAAVDTLVDTVVDTPAVKSPSRPSHPQPVSDYIDECFR